MRPLFDGNEEWQSWRFVFLVTEPLVVILPGDHRLAALKVISPRDLVGETFVAVSNRSQYHARPRGGPPLYGNVLNTVDAWRRAVASLRTKPSFFLCNKSSSQWRYADYRAGPRL